MSLNFAATKKLFVIPEGCIYLDGNSLGPLPKSAISKTRDVVEGQWGKMLITGWNKAGWMQQPIDFGNRIGRLIGAEHDHVVVGDTLSIKVYQALASALELRPERKTILSDIGNFPSDIYIAEGLIKSLGKGYEINLVPPEELTKNLNEDVAVLMLTEVDYRTGRMHDMASLNKLAHDVGALTVWDLAHSAGAIEVNLRQVGTDFAVGCTYKYLNAGPGAPAFIYIAPQHANTIRPAISGWLGHAEPFAFEPYYRSGKAIERMRIGTPPVIASAALDAALDIWDQVEMVELRAKSVELTELFIEKIQDTCQMLVLASPKDAKLRGSQVSFHFEEGYAAIQACISLGVIGDFRAPDIMRFGFAPLYIDEKDVLAACTIISKVMNERLWDRPAYKKKDKVT
ncbi:MAG: kynureninase [Rhodobacteraceae bacterium]|nr:kynureninase [Paracoccaceae bacterium]